MKKLESLENYSLSEHFTNKINGGIMTTGGGCHSNQTTWNSDSVVTDSKGRNHYRYNYDAQGPDECSIAYPGDIGSNLRFDLNPQDSAPISVEIFDYNASLNSIGA